MPRPIYIHVPNPCSQKWDEMISDSAGRHCAHCSKTVIDFTAWNDAALYDYFSKNPGHVCGRFLSSQVDRPIRIPYQPHSRLYRITIALGLTLLFTQTSHLLAQNRPPKIEQNASLTRRKYFQIEGSVRNKEGQSIPQCNIVIYKDNVKIKTVVCNDYGEYTIWLLHKGKYNFKLHSNGYEAKSMSFIINANRIQNFVLNNIANAFIVTAYKPPTVITGDVSTDYTMKSISIPKLQPIASYDTSKQKKVPFSNNSTFDENPTKRTFSREEINNMPH